MEVLVIGGGGREHALVWKIKQSPRVKKIYCAPGNAGTGEIAENIPIAADDIPSLLEFALQKEIGLTVVGPEQPLVMGVVDQFEEKGLRIFGPNARAAELEGSKSFAKDIMAKYGLPTAEYKTFSSADNAAEYIKFKNCPLVIKADGLAAGKGVLLCQTVDEALAAVDSIMGKKSFGKAGNQIVVEEFLQGQEVSVLAFSDGQTVLLMDSAQDHKAAYDGDKGPNTGGMGAYSPAPIVSQSIFKDVMVNVIRATVDAMASEGVPYTGFLYAGLMIDESNQVKVLEYNCRFGDPETQPIMMRLKSNLASLCIAATQGRLNEATIEWDPRASLGVVMAADGYPEKYAKGEKIELPSHSTNLKIFHAGTKIKNNNIYSNGGRVLCATALGQDIQQAQTRAYKLLEKVDWRNAYYRTDIGFKAI